MNGHDLPFSGEKRPPVSSTNVQFEGRRPSQAPCRLSHGLNQILQLCTPVNPMGKEPLPEVLRVPGFFSHMALSENRENPYSQWFCWSLSLLNGYFIGGIPHFQTYPHPNYGWLVVDLPYPSEKWWSESQLGWWHFPILWESHKKCSKPPIRWEYNGVMGVEGNILVRIYEIYNGMWGDMIGDSGV